METIKTSRKFKVTLLMRIIALIGLIIFCISFGGDIYGFFNKMPNEKNFIDLSIDVLIGLIFIYCTIAFNKEEYEIKNKTIIIRSFLTREKIINLSEIQKIEQINVWPFSFTKIFFSNGRKRNILPLDNQKAFIQIINSILRE